MKNGTKCKVLKEADVKHIEMLLSKGLKPEDITEIIGTSKTTVNRVKNGVHCLQRKPEEKAIEEAPVISEDEAVTSQDDTQNVLQNIVRNQETIIQLLREYLAEWRLS